VKEHVEDLVQRLRIGLERPFAVQPDPIVNVTNSRNATTWCVTQRCRRCAEALELHIQTTSGLIERSRLFGAVFAQYDAHRCELAIASADPARRQELFETTERESIRMATRAQALLAADVELAARAEHESSMLAEWAVELARLV
jgi:hypothetical protein